MSLIEQSRVNLDSLYPSPETCMTIALLSQLFLNLSSVSPLPKDSRTDTKEIDEHRHQIREHSSRGLLQAFRYDYITRLSTHSLAPALEPEYKPNQKDRSELGVDY